MISVELGVSELDNPDMGEVVIEIGSEEYARIPLVNYKDFNYITAYDCSTSPTTEYYFSQDNSGTDYVVVENDVISYG